MHEKKKMCKEKGRTKLPSFDGCAGDYDKWEIMWASLAEVEGLSNALGNILDPNMPWHLLLTT